MTNPELSKPSDWTKVQLSPTEARNAREEIGQRARGLSRALQNLRRGVGEDGLESRTYYRLPVNLAGRNTILSAMVAVTGNADEVINHYGLDGINSHRTDYDLRQNISPDQLEPPTDLNGAKAGYFEDDPVGYIHVAQTETGLETRVGALDPTTRTDYSFLLLNM